MTDDTHGKDTNTLVRLHEQRMSATEHRLETDGERFDRRIRCVEKQVNKIPWILLVVLVNILLSGGILVFNLMRTIH